jgi:CRISPR-associated protein Cmr4
MNAHTLLALYAQTNIHAGTGQNTISSIDLPIQREAHTGYPCVYGSATKGALRAKFDADSDKATTNRLFGSETSGDNGNAGCLAITDTRLLLLPVRSLTSHFKWVTCPALLNRFKQDMARMGKEIKAQTPAPKAEEAQVHTGAETGALYLEEYRLTVQPNNFSAWIESLVPMMPEGSKTALEKQLTIVSDDLFAFLAQNSTPVHAHNKINSDTKTVVAGALWWEESLPADTLLYTCIHAFNGRELTEDKKSNQVKAVDNLTAFTSVIANKPYLQIGGNETTGMGFCLAKCL